MTKRKGAQPAPRALRRFIYLIIYLYFAIHFDSVIEEVDSLSPPPCPPAPTKLTTLPSPAHTRTHTLTLPAEYHYDKKNYLIDVSTIVVPL